MTMTKFSRINKQREEITMRVLEDMEKGGNEWKKPWVEASPLPPHNPVSGTQYSGRNFLYWYDAKIHDKDNAVTSLDEKKNATLNNALLKASTRIRLISKRELEDVAKITLDGELVEWRQGGELVNGVKFFSQELLYFSNGRSASITERACKISQFIKNANPELPDEIIAGWMGLPPTVLETMKRDQLRNDQVSEQDD